MSDKHAEGPVTEVPKISYTLQIHLWMVLSKEKTEYNSPDRAILASYVEDIKNAPLPGPPRLCCVVPAKWKRTLIKWLEGDPIVPSYRVDFSDIISHGMLKFGAKLNRDYEIVEDESWRVLSGLFNIKNSYRVFVYQRNASKQPEVIADFMKIRIRHSEKVYIEPADYDWSIGEFISFFCQNHGDDPDKLSLYDAKMQEIPSSKYMGDFSDSSDTFVLSIKGASPPKRALITRPHIKKLTSTLVTPKRTLSSPLPALLTMTTPIMRSMTPRPSGLINLGNTCYFNSAVQCLCRIKPLTSYILSSAFDKDINTSNKLGSGGKIAHAYRHFLQTMLKSVAPVDPSELRKAVVKKYRAFANYSQHDSQELLLSLIDGLHEDLNQSPYALGMTKEGDVFSKNQSPIFDMLSGTYHSQITCKKCGYTETIKEPFLTLSLPVTSEKLEGCIESFQQGDDLEWKCDRCDCLVPAERKLLIGKCAEILIIHLKRFTKRGTKISTFVKYPEALDIGKCVKDMDGVKYRLIGAVFHSGGLGGGHYTAASVDDSSGKWHLFNDSYVSEITIDEAISSSAYIFFYKRI